MDNKTKRINLWAGPRNISTALMYSFAQRADTCVYDEPLYAHYLSQTDAHTYHPGAAEILASMETDGTKVVQMMRGSHPKSVVFFKQMTHHLVALDWSFLLDMQNVILTRAPYDMLPSYAEQVEAPTLRDVGYAAHIALLDFLEKHHKPVIVLDGKKVRQAPQQMLARLCAHIGIAFDKNMLSWEAGARPEDGCWATYWYQRVHQSTGFIPPSVSKKNFPAQLRPLLEECMPLYERLRRYML